MGANMATKKAKPTASLSPVHISNAEMNLLKMNDPVTALSVHKRIVKATPKAEKRKARTKVAKGSPLKVTADQLALIRKSGKLPAEMGKALQKAEANLPVTKRKPMRGNQPQLPPPGFQ
jgi:hypothetical protein